VKFSLCYELGNLNLFGRDSSDFSNFIYVALCLFFLSDISLVREGKAIPLQAWTGSGDSRRLRLPASQSAHECGKVVSSTHWPSLPHKLFLVLISVRGWVDPRAIVRPEELC
jgi:hypothetical protein